MIIKLYHFIDDFLDRMKQDHIGAYASQASFFLLLSAAPFISLLLSMLQFLPVSETAFLETTIHLLPKAFHSFATTIIEDMYSQSTNVVISLSLFMTLWSAGNGIRAIMDGLISIYRIEDNCNYFVARLISSIYTILFLFAFTSTLVFIVFSNTIYSFLNKHSFLLAELANNIFNHRIFITNGILIVFFIFVYRMVKIPKDASDPEDKNHPDITKRRRHSYRSVIPGAVFSSIAWTIFSYLFSLYIDIAGDFSYTYGSLSSIVIVMLWLYVCMYIVFIGAEMNQYITRYLNDEERLEKKTKSRHLSDSR